MATFKLKNGDVSFYGFCCGHIQVKENENKKVELYKEGGVYHVKAFNKKGGNKEWNSFDSLRDARNNFKTLAK